MRFLKPSILGRGSVQSEFIIVGAGGHAKVVADAIQCMKGGMIHGFLDSERKVGEVYCGYPVLGGEECLLALLKDSPVLKVVVAIGHNWYRRIVVERLLNAVPAVQFGAVIHPRASVARGASTGPGAVVLAGSVIGPDVRVGAHAIVNHMCSVDHDSILESYSSLAPGVVAGGYVTVEGGAAVSTGAVVGRGVRIGAHAVVGAGATVLRDVPEKSFAIGTPARVLYSRDVADSYF